MLGYPRSTTLNYTFMCIRGKAELNLSFVLVFKHHTHRLYILGHSTNIVFACISDQQPDRNGN